MHDLVQAMRACTTRDALGATLEVEEIEEYFGEVHHAGVLVANQQRARAERDSRFAPRLKVQRRILHVRGDDGTARSARLHQFEFRALLHALPVNINHFAQGDAERDLDHTRKVDVPHDGVNLRPAAFLGAELVVPFAAVADDVRDVGERLHVVDRRRFAPHAVGRRVGRAGARLSAFAFDGFDQRSFLAADISARASM